MRIEHTSTRVYQAVWIQRSFMQMSPTYRGTRARMRKPMDACFRCHRKFADGEMMALGCFGKAGNKVLCQSCVDAHADQALVTGPGIPDQRRPHERPQV